MAVIPIRISGRDSQVLIFQRVLFAVIPIRNDGRDSLQGVSLVTTLVLIRISGKDSKRVKIDCSTVKDRY